MTTRTLLERKIENKKQEIAELETKLREANAFLQGLQEALKLVPKEGSEERPPEQVLRPGSNIAKAREALQSAGKPMYISDILKAIGLEDKRNTRASIAGSLGNYARKGLIFSFLGQNRFGLREFTPQPTLVEEPPSGFGIDEDE